MKNRKILKTNNKEIPAGKIYFQMALYFGIPNYELENYFFTVLRLHKMQKLDVMFKIHSPFLKDQSFIAF